MNSQPPTLEDLQNRLLKLEKQNRRMKYVGVVVLAVIAVIVVMGQAPSKKIVEANEFILKDDGGKVRGKLWTNGDESIIDLVDEYGRGRLQLDAGNYQSTISVMDSNGKPRAKLSSNNAGITELKFSDAKGKDMVNVNVYPDVGSAVQLSNRDGKTNAVLGASSDGMAFLRIEKAGFVQDGLNVIT